MAGLSVNVDHVATLRNARGTDYPDPVAAASIVEFAGADGVVLHLREDRRHIRDRDLTLVREVVKTKLILEMAATDEMLGIAAETRPHQVTLVPERREEVTTEGGLDLVNNQEQVNQAVRNLHREGIRVSLFIDPDPESVRLADEVNADVVELHTGTFCDAPIHEAGDCMKRIAQAAELAHSTGLGVHAGHGIHYHNIKQFKGVSQIEEFSIGHAIVSKAVFVGLDRAVAEMAALIKEL